MYNFVNNVWSTICNKIDPPEEDPCKCCDSLSNKNIECESILNSFVDCLEENSFNITSEYRCYDIVNKYRRCLRSKHL